MEISSCIIYEDTQLLVCHKPCGLAVQSARMDTMDLESAVKNYLAENPVYDENGQLITVPYAG